MTQIGSALTGDFIKSLLIVNGELEHVVSRVPSGPDIPWHDTLAEFELFADLAPSREEFCGRIFDGESYSTKLEMRSVYFVDKDQISINK